MNASESRKCVGLAENYDPMQRPAAVGPRSPIDELDTRAFQGRRASARGRRAPHRAQPGAWIPLPGEATEDTTHSWRQPRFLCLPPIAANPRANTMSMEMRVFFAGPMPTPVAVTPSMQRLGLNFAITDRQCEFEAYGGFMPMSYGDGADAHETGVEVYVGSARETIDDLGIEGIDPKLNNEISFRWGGDLMEGACAAALAAAIATLTGGVMWDDSEGVIISVETALEYCHELSTAK